MNLEAGTGQMQDSRHWTKTLQGLGPLSYLSKEVSLAREVFGELGTVVALDTERAVLAVGARATRGLGMISGLFFLSAAGVMLLLARKFSASSGSDFALYLFGAGALLTGLLGLLFISADLNRVAEALVVLNRKSRQIIAADPIAKVGRQNDIRLLIWDWDRCDFAIERVIMTAAAGQTFHLRAVQRDVQGNVVHSIVLVAMIPSFQHAEAVFEFLLRFMTYDDSHLPNRVKLAPAGRLGLFESFKYRFISNFVSVGNDGLPTWPWPLVALFYALLSIGLVIGLPFVLGTVVAEWSSREMKLPDGAISGNGEPIDGIELMRSQHGAFASWEKPYYVACIALGSFVWMRGIGEVINAFGI